MIKRLLILMIAFLAAGSASLQASEAAPADSAKAINPKEIIFEHLGDGYGWEVPFSHEKRIPLPVIVFGKDGGIHCFSSSRVAHGATYTDGDATFKIGGHDSKYKGKLVEIVDGEEFRPLDFSITKNVAGIFITAILVVLCVLSVARWHARMGHKAPRKGVGLMEMAITFIYDGAIKPVLKEKSMKFAPYLLTVFFFILFMNLLGLIVIFPGGANLTGNIAVTLTLAVLTFLVTNIFGTKHYWKEVFWPDVPVWLKFPLPIMPVIEIFGVFTKPAALTVRLFANMMGGHMIVLVLTLLIFIFAPMGAFALGLSSVISVMFSVFMILIDVLVSCIQAYVFMMLSCMFISFAQEEGHESHPRHDAETVTVPDTK